MSNAHGFRHIQVVSALVWSLLLTLSAAAPGVGRPLEPPPISSPAVALDTAEEAGQLLQQAPEDAPAPESTAALRRSTVAVPPPTAGEREYYTIQLASLPTESGARVLYDKAVNDLAAGPKDLLRVEKIGDFFAIRIGAADNRRQARRLLQQVTAFAPKAYILSAYIRPERMPAWSLPAIRHRQPEHTATPAAATAPQPPPARPAPAVSPAAAGATPPATTTPSGDIASPMAAMKTAQTTAPTPAMESAARKAISHGQTSAAPPAATAVPTFAVNMIAAITMDNLGEKIHFPTALFWDNQAGELYVIASGRVLLYNSDDFPLTAIGADRGIESPTGGMITRQGRLYLCQSARGERPDRLSILNGALYPQQTIPLTDYSHDLHPTVPVVGPGHQLYLGGGNAPGVLILDQEHRLRTILEVHDPKFDRQQKNTSKQPLPVPIRDLTVDADGNLYLLSEVMGRVYVYDQQLHFRFAFAQKGGSQGKLSRPRGIAVDTVRRCIYVVDYMRHTILQYDINGNFIREFGGQGWGPGWFNYPADIALTPTGDLYVADFYNHRVQHLQLIHDRVYPDKDPTLWQ